MTGAVPSPTAPVVGVVLAAGLSRRLGQPKQLVPLAGQTLLWHSTRAMLDAARAGRDAAIPLRAQVGRSNWVGERTEGQADPGTVLFVSALEAVLEADPSEPGSTLL